MSLLSDLKLWSHYKVVLEFVVPCIGGTPNSKNLIKGWLETKNLATSEAELAALVDATVEQIGGKVEEKASAMWTVFKLDDMGLYIEGRQVKAMFKESSNILRDMLIKATETGAKGKNRFTNLKSKVAERLFVVEDRIYFQREGANLRASDGSDERPIHVVTAQGPRTALKRSDYVKAGTQVGFNVKLLNDSVVDEELVKVLLEHSSENGLGSDRSQGFGRFKVVSVEAR